MSSAKLKIQRLSNDLKKLGLNSKEALGKIQPWWVHQLPELPTEDNNVWLLLPSCLNNSIEGNDKTSYINLLSFLTHLALCRAIWITIKSVSCKTRDTFSWQFLPLFPNGALKWVSVALTTHCCTVTKGLPLQELKFSLLSGSWHVGVSLDKP